MNYSTIQDLCIERKMKIKELCSYIGMSYPGLRTSLESGKLSADKCLALCECLKITPNRFFGCPEDPRMYNTTQFGVQNNQQIGTANLDILREQLTIKDEQIKQLLNLLNK